MAIANCICDNCDHVLVCDIFKKKLSIFSEEAKINLGVNITLDGCLNFKEAN